VNGHARYSAGGAGFDGTVGSQGELVMRKAPTPVVTGSTPGVERIINGRIEGNGTARAHLTSYYCSDDFTWQKEVK
jgi:hypothetical protein